MNKRDILIIKVKAMQRVRELREARERNNASIQTGNTQPGDIGDERGTAQPPEPATAEQAGQRAGND